MSGWGNIVAMGSSGRVVASFALAVLAVACSGSAGGRWPAPGASERAATAADYADVLSARYAGLTRDQAAAAQFYERSYQRRPHDPVLLESAVLSALVAGGPERALLIAADASPEVLAQSPFARLAAAIEAIVSGRVSDAEALLERGDLGALNEDVATALRAALLASDGNVDAALQLIDDYEPQGRVGADFEVVKGLFLASAGRLEEAADVFQSSLSQGQRTPGAILAQVQVLGSLGEREEAMRVLEANPQLVAYDAELFGVSRALKGGDAFDYPRASRRSLAAAALHAVTSRSIVATRPETSALYSALVLALDPEFDRARLTLAKALADQNRLSEALEMLERIDPARPLGAMALMDAAGVLRRMGREEDAVTAAEQAVERTQGARSMVLRSADLLRLLGRNAEAEAALSRVAAIDAADGSSDWRVFFMRANERMALDRWPEAEQDLQKALQLAPDEPDVLNSLGYAWVDRGVRVEEGLDLIRRAIKAVPTRGYIIDSLGWAYYRLGRYEEAVRELERAAELEPAHPVIADHLGDAYWRAGRGREAVFTWSRVLTLSPDPELDAAVRIKLSDGLPDEPAAAYHAAREREPAP